jgi:tryptophan aminotransferase
MKHLWIVRSLLPLESRPGMISLLAGKPNAASFPFTSLSFTARDPRSGEESALQIAPENLSAGLQYGPTAGFPPFVEWLVGLQEREHGRHRSEGWRVSVGVGSQDLINKVSGIKEQEACTDRR